VKRVRELFDIQYGHSLSLNKLTETDSEHGVAFVSRTARNNGVSAWVERITDVEPLSEGLLTVSLRSRNHPLATFVQPRPFYCGYHIFVLRPKKEMSLEEKLWWANCIEANRYRYNFGRQANRSLANLELPDAAAEWVAELKAPTFERTSGEVAAERPTATWGRYRLGEFFELYRGHNILKRNMGSGDTAYVSASALNNGVSAWINEEPDFQGGQLTVCSNGSVGQSFYQADPFIASGDVTVLVPKFDMSETLGLFLSTIITAERYRFNYGRKWVTSRMRDSEIHLPAAKDGTPDWDLMRNYIASLDLASLVLGKGLAA
jgi:hypothetical protein